MSETEGIKLHAIDNTSKGLDECRTKARLGALEQSTHDLRLQVRVLGITVLIIAGVLLFLTTGCSGGEDHADALPTLEPAVHQADLEGVCIGICKGVPPPATFGPEEVARCGKILPCRQANKRGRDR